MQLAVVQRILGLLLMGFSLSMLPPMAVSHWYGDGQIRYFFIPLLTMIGLGLLIWYPVRRCALELRTHHGFIIVTLFWSVLGVVSALPFYLAPHPHLSFTDAVFEAVSGFTTTGATVISGLDALPKSMLYYRAQLHFLGGMGIVVLAVAIMPMLGVGGMTLYRAETPGPMKDEKLTPRITHTARALWLVYVGLNVACALAYWGAGMSPFDAVTHAFGTIATGGFSNYDASFAQFQSPLLEVIATVFMFLGGVNFAVHFLAFGDRSFKPYCHDIETRAFLWICLGLSVLVALLLLWEGVYGDPLSALRYAAFQVVSIITTTGFTSAGFAEWPSFLPILLIYISFIGGCAGSTAGGIKVVRVQLLVRQALREVSKLIHPRAVIPIRVGDKLMSEGVLSAVWGFFALYAFSTAVLTLLLVGSGLDVLSAFSAVAACLNVMGPGLGVVASNMIGVSDAGIWILIFTMLLGRLELFTLFVLLTPAFWRK